MKILVVDDEPVALTSVQRLLRRRGLRDVEICAGGREAVDLLKRAEFDVVLLDLLMPEVDGFQVLEATKPFCPDTEFLLLTAVDDVATAVKAVRLGAYDYLVKPVDNERLVLSIERAYEHKGLLAGRAHSLSESEKTALSETFGETIGQCPQMKELLAYAHVMARSGVPILITGESGTGKELLARGIHRASAQAEGPLVAVNVASIPATLFESQVFGHVAGSFTGASTDHVGYFEQAEGGTLFLDEVGELPISLQVKLLRVLEEKRITRIGSMTQVGINVRVIAATNQDLDVACKNGVFRLDLLYRLKAAHIRLPPLRERIGDITVLANHFLRQACARHGKDVAEFSPEAMSALMQQEFPGNIRELAQVVEHAVLIARSGVIQPEDLGGQGSRRQTPTLARTLTSLKEDSDKHLAYVLLHTAGDRQRAAEILGVTLRQVQRRLSEIKRKPEWRGLVGDI